MTDDAPTRPSGDDEPAAGPGAPAEPAETAASAAPEAPEGFRAGFACFVGRPNAGKSTLTNALVGAKVASTPGRPQTTRHNVRGADEKVGPGDRFIARDLTQARPPVVAVVTKADAVTRQDLAAQLLAVDALGDWADIVPVSALRGEQIDVLTDVLVSHLPPSPPLYPADEITDEPRAVMIGELVREAALEDVRQELPHSLAVVVDEILDPDTDTTGSRIKGEGGRLQVRVSLVVERDSQKAIMIGRRGSRLKRIGTAARKGIEELVGRPVYLDLHVRTAKDWQSDPKALARLGF